MKWGDTCNHWPFSRGSSSRTPYWSGWLAWPAALCQAGAEGGSCLCVASTPSTIWASPRAQVLFLLQEHLLLPTTHPLQYAQAPWGLWGYLSHLCVTHSPDTEPWEALGGAQQTFPEGMKRQTGAWLCPEPADIMGIVLIFFQRIRRNVGTRGRREAWIFAIFSPVFPPCSFCLKIPVIWERTSGCGRNHKITSSLVRTFLPSPLLTPAQLEGKHREASPSQAPDSFLWEVSQG